MPPLHAGGSTSHLVSACAEDLNEGGLVCSRPLHGPAKALGVIQCLGLQHGQQQVLQVPTQFTLQLTNQILEWYGAVHSI